MLDDLRFRVRALFRRSVVERELDDELRFHFDRQVEKYMNSQLFSWGAVRATVIGGLSALTVAGLWAVLFPDLRKADGLTSEALRPRQPKPEDATAAQS